MTGPTGRACELGAQRAGVRPSGSGRPSTRKVAVRVLASRQAMVIGPTPPGTGVIAPATSAAAAKSTSPTSRRLAVRPVDAVDPDVDHRGAGLDPVARHHPGRPTAATRMSARRQTAGRSRVRECAIVTVQLSPSRSCAIGLPTMLERPTTTASCPARSPTGRAAASGSRAGCRAPAPARPIARRPALPAWKPSTSLSGADRRRARAWRRSARGSGSCTRMPWTRGSALSRSTSAEQLGLGRRRRSSRCSSECMPTSTVCLPLLRT